MSESETKETTILPKGRDAALWNNADGTTVVIISLNLLRKIIAAEKNGQRDVEESPLLSSTEKERTIGVIIDIPRINQ